MSVCDVGDISSFWWLLKLLLNVLVGGGWEPESYSRSPEELHPEQREDQDEQEEEEEQTEDGSHAAQQGDDEIAQRGPVPVWKEEGHPLLQDGQK